MVQRKKGIKDDSWIWGVNKWVDGGALIKCWWYQQVSFKPVKSHLLDMLDS
jgi:hypothetical protein